jgi:serine O-acetyltransferase
LKIKYGFDISYRTKIGRGLYLGHFGGVVIHGDTIIGDNCNISQGVTIGVSNHNRIGSPMIGNNVFLGPGATVIGQIEIGHNVTIGTNSIVNFHVPDCTTVVASRSHIIEKDLSPYYIQNKT